MYMYVNTVPRDTLEIRDDLGTPGRAMHTYKLFILSYMIFYH